MGDVGVGALGLEHVPDATQVVRRIATGMSITVTPDKEFHPNRVARIER